MSGVYWGSNRDSRYSGTSRGIGGIRKIGASRGCWDHLEGIRGHHRCKGVRGVLGG